MKSAFHSDRIISMEDRHRKAVFIHGYRKLVKPTCQRLVYVGSSRASAYLETIFLSDVSTEEYPALVEQLDTDIEPSPQGVAKWLGMEAQ